MKKPRKGVVSLYREADDVVGVAQYQEDAERVYRAGPRRLSTFTGQVAEDKTRRMACSRVHPGASVACLGLPFRWEQSRQGKWVVPCRPSGQKFRRTMAHGTEWCRTHRSRPLQRRWRARNATRRGSDNTYGLLGTSDSLNAFLTPALSRLEKWLQRRRQRRRDTWERFEALRKRQQIARPRITDTPPHQRVLSLALR